MKTGKITQKGVKTGRKSCKSSSKCV